MSEFSPNKSGIYNINLKSSTQDTYKKTPNKRNEAIFINPQIYTTQKKHYKRNIYGT